MDEDIIQYFSYMHLPTPLREISETFAKQASKIIALCPQCEERTVALRKLLESKDAAVRSAVEIYKLR